jgi:hypothetical protein
MAINVELFDGTILEFPDGTDREVMLAAGRRITLERQMNSNIEPRRNDLGEVQPRGSMAYEAISKVADVARPYVEPVTDYIGEQASLVAGAGLKGVANLQTSIAQNQVAGMMELQEARKAKYGTFENMPPKEQENYIKAQKYIEEKLGDVAKLGLEKKNIEKQYGVRASTKALDSLSESPEYKDASFIGKMGMIGSKIGDDPFGIITDLGLESIPQSYAIAASAIATRFGMLNPKIAAGVGGAGSGMMQFGNEYAALREQGLDHVEAWEKAGVKSGIVGLFDAASFYSAGKAAGAVVDNIKKGAIKETVKTVAKETGKQGALGAAGEGVGSAVIGQEVDPLELTKEAIGEIFGAPGDAISTYQSKVAEARAAGKPDPAPPVDVKKMMADKGFSFKPRTTIEQDLKGKDIIYPEDTQAAAPSDVIEIKGVGRNPDEVARATEEELIGDIEASQDRRAMLAEIEDERDQERELKQVTVQKPAVKLTPSQEKVAPADPVPIKAIPKEEFLAKVQDPDIAGELQAMAANAGWAQVGGKLLRENMEDQLSPVIGRTTWIPKEPWWQGRPKGMTEGKTNAAVRKAIAGEKLNIPEKRMIEYMINVAEGNLAGAVEERARLEESDRQLAEIDQQNRTDEARAIANKFVQMGQSGLAQAIIKNIEDGKTVTPATIEFLRGKLQELSQPAPMELTGQTPDELRAQATEIEKQQADQQRAELEQERAEKATRERAEIKQRSEAAADDFQLGQTAVDNLTGQKNVFDDQIKESPKSTTAKELVGKTPDLNAELKALPKENMSTFEKEAMDIADRIESYGEEGFAAGLRAAVKAGRIKSNESLDFYKQREQDYAARLGKAKEKVSEKLSMDTFMDNYENDRVRLLEANELFATQTSDLLDKVNGYLQKLADEANRRGYKVLDINTGSPFDIQEIGDVINQMAGSMNLVLKQTEAFKKGYDRANEKKFQSAIATLDNDFKDADAAIKTSQQSDVSKNEADNEPMFETIKSKPGANVARIANLLGPQLYGSMSDITSVSVKEMLQNSFDAIKTMLEQKKMDAGLINIVLDKDQRTIAMTDDGSGMSPDTLANTFLTIAGTKKDTEFGSGGFGIAKMLFLFGNENVEVITMKDGKISSMSATGEQLMAALEDPSKAPDIQIDTKNEMPDWNKMFPKGHGTFVRVTVPKTFKDKSTGEEKEVDFSDNVYSFNSLQNSPLFANISVMFNDRPVYDIGDKFPANEYTTFVDAKFNWGTARIYVSNEQKDKYGSNLHVLSNGLFQFSEDLKLDPNKLFGSNIPHRFYLDIVSKVKPDEEGYPFQLNRQGFTKEAEKDLKLIQNYLVLHYRQKDYSSSVQNFGTVQYLSKKGLFITASAPESLIPDIPETETKDTINEGSKVEVKNGKLIVNGKDVPLLTPEDLKNASIDISSLRIPQDRIDPNKVMIHDNLEVAITDDIQTVEEKRERRSKIADLRAELQSQIFKLEDADYAGNQVKIKKLEAERLELSKEDDRLFDEILGISKPKDLKYIPISTLARDKFGERFDNFMFDIGDTFAFLRDGVANLMPPDSKGVDYSKLATEAIGVSFDKEYRGVSIMLPFNGLFINPAFPEYIDTPEEAALGMFGTMIHELAHHKVRSHDADFPAEMQRILIKLESSPNFDIQKVKKGLIASVKDNMDIIKFLNKEGSNEFNRPIGKRFKDSQQQSRGEDTSEDVPGARQEQRREPRVFSKSGQRDNAAQQKQESKSVPPSGKTPKVNRKNYKGDKAPLADWQEPDDSKLDNFLYKVQDKLIDTKRVQQAITKQVGEIEDNWNAYMKEELYHGRTAKRTQDFLKKELSPIVKELAKANIDIGDFDQFLHNRHAEERNVQIAKINPSMPDSGSGIATADAQQYMKDLDPTKRKLLEKLANKIDSIVKGTQKILIDSGLEEQSTIDVWNKTYKHYVPLKREDVDFVHTGTGLGQGYATRGGTSARATGSLKSVAEIFGNLALQRERAIIRAEKARVGKAMYGLAIKNPNPDFWLPVNPDAIKNKAKLEQELVNMGLDPIDAKNLIQEPRQQYIDPRTGLVAYRVNPVLRSSDNVFPVRINGQDRFIFFNSSNERAMRMVSAIKNLDADQLGFVMNITSNVTRWLASVNTQYNPVFGAINFGRDVQGAALNLSTTPLAGKQKEVLAGTLPALKGIYQNLRTGKGGMWADLFEDYQLAGGQTGYRDQFSRNRRQASIVEREMGAMKRGKVKKAAFAVAQWLSDYNDAMENAVRLSAYKTALDMGLSKEQAASIAKNLTVNFNRKGTYAQTVGALYAFFNASVQGTARLAETMKGPAGRKIFYGGLALGSLQAVALLAAGFDDDEPPEFIKSRNLIIPTGGKTYIAIPMPLGFNMFPNLGRLTTEFVLSGGKKPVQKTLDIASMIFNTFNPIGGTGLQLVSPTILDPMVALYTNVDAFGRPISKEDRKTAPTPGYTRSREEASTVGKYIAEFLNYASGGTKYQKGALSPTADQLDYLVGQATGGVGRETVKAVGAVKAVVTGEELPSYKVPIAGKFYGNTESPANIASKFYDNVTQLSNYENEIRGRQKNRENVGQFLRDHPEARLYQRANKLENQISQINKDKKDLIERKAPQKQIDVLDKRKTMLMDKFNKDYKKASK